MNYDFLKGQNVLLPLSGGINSAAILCHMKQCGAQPSELHLYYSHFREHSPGTERFVTDLMRYARQHFPNVKLRITRNWLLKYFAGEKMIPHPKASPCSIKLKIEPAEVYAFENEIKIDLVGYVKDELKRRAGRQQKQQQTSLFSTAKYYPVGEYTDEWCFDIVKQELGYYPAIYDIRDAQGNRIFKHNNCLPCKNMTTAQLEYVRLYYPQYFAPAMALSHQLQAYFGRDKDLFYATFGRDLGQDTTCGHCML